jgi:23S rRNA pseudouridine2605 synthase/16S rRNA pseudouridine516 synthase
MPRAEAEAAVRAGRVTVAGRRVTQPLTLVRPGDEVRLDGRRIDLSPATIALAFHKPADCVVSTRGEPGAKTVFELLLSQLSPDLAGYGWHAIGRLDKGTTGLLLFTNDERLVAHATLPETHLPKRYLAKVQGEPDEARLEPLRQGVELDDGRAKPASARIRGPGLVELVIQEGRFHQVKRMLGAVGLPVLALHREAIGGIELGSLPEGSWRRLSEAEIREGLGFG